MVQFAKWKFNRMLVVGTLTMAVNYVVMLSGSVVVGNLVGADGLAGINVCMPVFGGVGFLASLLSVGTALVFSRAMGAFDAKRAAGVYSQSLMLALVLALLIFGGMALAEGPFLDLAGVTGSVREQAAHYWRGQTLVLCLTPVVLLVEALVYADGDGLVAACAGGVHVVGAIGLSVLFTTLCGHAGGAAFGTALAMLLALLAAGLHGLRRENHLRARLHLSWPDLRETLAASLADSTIYLCWGALVLVVNRFTVAEFGQGLLPVVALATSVVEFSIVFDGVGEALIAVGGMYAGEENKPALRALAGHSALVATLEGVACGAVLHLLAPEIAGLYGFRGESAPLLAEAVRMERTLAFAMPFMGLLMMMNTHYLVVRHIPFAVSVTAMKDFVCPCVGVLALGAPFGPAGVWAGFAAGYAAATAYPFLFVLCRHGRDLFPWLIERDDGRALDFTVKLTPDALAAARARIGEFLNERDVFETDGVLAAVETAGRATIAANAHPVRAEYYVSAEEPGAVRLVLRDSGRPFASPVGKYLNTLGCNRTECRFDILSR